MPRFLLLIVLALPLCFEMKAQNAPGPVARFSFNNRSTKDEVSGQEIKIINASFSRDRFGNKDNALYLYGNSDSYINLGSSQALKPGVGSVSMWVYMESPVWSGKGRYMNPFILTKNGPGDDFYEAYCIAYFNESRKISALCSQDSLRQLSITSLENFVPNRWYHLALTYNSTVFAFYINGRLEKKLPKHFETKFLGSDSVVLGTTANKKNDRYFDGVVDDLTFYDRVLSPDEILDLYHAPNPNKGQIILNGLIASAVIIACASLIALFIRYRITKVLQREKQKLELFKKSLENEMRVHRALMNPHFIFNVLNGVQTFILTNAKEAANDYLVKCSQLIRKILESNMSDTISLRLEIELLERYLEIEEMRFEEDIRHQIIVDPLINVSGITIPIMMIQPFVENAIWHGLLDKEGEKVVTVGFYQQDEKYLRCTIEDNGVGRKEVEARKGEKKSLATLFIRQRLDLLNKLHNLQCSLTITDKEDRGGTIVTLILPVS